MSEPLVIDPVMQKDSWDCGVACLVMLTGKSYGVVSVVVPKRARRDGGLGQTQMRNIATRVGVSTRWIKDGDLQEVVGILGLTRPIEPANPKSDREGHYVMILKGVLYNPAEGVIWTDVESFFQTRGWRPMGVLVRED